MADQGMTCLPANVCVHHAINERQTRSVTPGEHRGPQAGCDASVRLPTPYAGQPKNRPSEENHLFQGIGPSDPKATGVGLLV
jgi:hypothetical protein